MKVAWEQNLGWLLWAEARLGVRFNPDDVTWLTIVEKASDTNPLAVVIYSRFSTGNCEMSVVSRTPRFLTRRILKELFAYPFHQLNLPRVMTVVDTTNPHAYEFNRRLGFQVEGRLREWFEGSDGILLGMLRKECKWL